MMAARAIMGWTAPFFLGGRHFFAVSGRPHDARKGRHYYIRMRRPAKP
jgi:hypothetical protein